MSASAPAISAERQWLSSIMASRSAGSNAVVNSFSDGMLPLQPQTPSQVAAQKRLEVMQKEVDEVIGVMRKSFDSCLQPDKRLSELYRLDPGYSAEWKCGKKNDESKLERKKRIEFWTRMCIIFGILLLVGLIFVGDYFASWWLIDKEMEQQLKEAAIRREQELLNTPITLGTVQITKNKLNKSVSSGKKSASLVKHPPTLPPPRKIKPTKPSSKTTHKVTSRKTTLPTKPSTKSTGKVTPPRVTSSQVTQHPHPPAKHSATKAKAKVPPAKHPPATKAKAKVPPVKHRATKAKANVPPVKHRATKANKANVTHVKKEETRQTNHHHDKGDIIDDDNEDFAEMDDEVEIDDTFAKLQDAQVNPSSGDFPRGHDVLDQAEVVDGEAFVDDALHPGSKNN